MGRLFVTMPPDTRALLCVSFVTSAALLLLPPLAARADEPPLAPIPEAPSAYLQRPPPVPAAPAAVRAAPAPRAASSERAAALAAPDARASAPQRTRGPRIGFETVGGLLGVGASAIVGVFGWGFAGVTLCQSAEPSCSAAGALIFGALSSLALVPLGVIVGSRATRGNGGYAWSVLGAALGLVPGTAGGYWVAQETGRTAAAIPVLAVFAIFGAVLGYELSADAPPTAVERLFTPVATVDASGFSVGLRATL